VIIIKFVVGDLVHFKKSKETWKIEKKLKNGVMISKGNAKLFVKENKLSKERLKNE
jgi:hypothetical protein